MSTNYPAQAFAVPLTVIRRERRLPPEARGEATVPPGARVDAFDVVAEGTIARRYVVVDVAARLNVKNPDDLQSKLLAYPGKIVTQGEVLASSEPNERGTVIRAPVMGLVSQVAEGRLFLETDLSEVQVRAGFVGQVTSVRAGRGVLLETNGALVQGAWGNGQIHFATLALEPQGGLMAMEEDAFSSWRGTIVLTQGALDRATLHRAIANQVGGLIAPSMPADLRGIVLGLKIPVLLTEGFGNQPMSPQVYSVLAEMTSPQVAVMAHQPQYGKPDRPEVIVPQYSSERPPAPDRDLLLRVGSEVRVTQAPYAGLIARVRGLPPTPQALENGLRVMVADLRLSSGRDVQVPLDNLELLNPYG